MFNSPTQGFPWNDLRKIFTERSFWGGGQDTEWRRNIAENFNRVSRVHELRCRQTTDVRQTDDTDGQTMTYSSLKTVYGLWTLQKEVMVVLDYHCSLYNDS